MFLQVEEGGEALMPDLFEDRLSNFFSNIPGFRNLFNAMQQRNLEATLNTLRRFFTNCIFGFGRFFQSCHSVRITSTKKILAKRSDITD
ncbi:MAG: VacJ family lipoprotein [Nitrospira sp.]|nr:VacJ family lipoprotein [Nitrospira sp.]